MKRTYYLSKKKRTYYIFKKKKKKEENILLIKKEENILLIQKKKTEENILLIKKEENILLIQKNRREHILQYLIYLKLRLTQIQYGATARHRNIYISINLLEVVIIFPQSLLILKPQHDRSINVPSNDFPTLVRYA